MQKLAILSVERSLDLVVVYAIGDATGPAVDHLRFGVSARKSFATLMENFALYRSAPIVAHVECVVSGKAAGLRLKSAVEASLKENGRHIRASWFRVSGEEALRAMVEQSAGEGVRVLTQDEASELEQKALNKLMDGKFG